MTDEIYHPDETELIGERTVTRYVQIDKVMDLQWDGNAKLHDIQKVWDSIAKYGFRDKPSFDINLTSVTGTKGAFVFGNGRTEAVFFGWEKKKALPRGILEDENGMWYVPVEFGLDADNEANAAAFAIDHNNLTLSGGRIPTKHYFKMYDKEQIASTWDELIKDKDDLISFQGEDICKMFGDLVKIEEEFPDDEPSTLAKKWGVELGDLWIIPSHTSEGTHRLLCGSSLDPHSRDLLIDISDQYTLFCDPFYEEAIIDNLSAIWDFSQASFLTNGEQLRDVLRNVGKYHNGVLLGARFGAQKGNYRRPAYAHKTIVWASDIALDYGVDFQTVIQVENVSTSKIGDVYHHTAKEPQSVRRILSPFSNDVIVDLFAGLGAGFIAAEELCRVCYGIDINPDYCAAILERLESAGLVPEKVS